MSINTQYAVETVIVTSTNELVYTTTFGAYDKADFQIIKDASVDITAKVSSVLLNGKAFDPLQITIPATELTGASGANPITLEIRRNTPIIQPFDLDNGNFIDIRSQEQALDRTTLIQQELRGDFDNTANAEASAIAAKASELAAEQAKIDAENSANSASLSESNASNSETAAASYSANAQTQANAAATKADYAANSANMASAAAAAASASANHADLSEQAAQASEANAATSEANAATSEANAATSEANAAASAASVSRDAFGAGIWDAANTRYNVTTGKNFTDANIAIHQHFRIVPDSDNPGSGTTVKIDGMTPRTVKYQYKSSKYDLLAGEMAKNSEMLIRWDGTDFVAVGGLAVPNISIDVTKAVAYSLYIPTLGAWVGKGLDTITTNDICSLSSSIITFDTPCLISATSEILVAGGNGISGIKYNGSTKRGPEVYSGSSGAPCISMLNKTFAVGANHTINLMAYFRGAGTQTSKSGNAMRIDFLGRI